jgi:hypothetical protein
LAGAFLLEKTILKQLHLPNDRLILRTQRGITMPKYTMLWRWRSLKNHEASEASFRGLRLPIRLTGLTGLVKPSRVFPPGAYH